MFEEKVSTEGYTIGGGGRYTHLVMDDIDTDIPPCFLRPGCVQHEPLALSRYLLSALARKFSVGGEAETGCLIRLPLIFLNR